MRPGIASGLQRHGWTGLTLLLATMAITSWTVQQHDAALAGLLAWHRDSAPWEIWRYWTSAGLHWSGWHLGANLIACGVLAAWGSAGQLGAGPCIAWLLAWPLTQAGLWWTHDLQHFGGLSGVLHAGVAVGAAELLTRPNPSERRLGMGVILGLGVKLVSELPSASPVTLPGAPGYPIAFEAHWVGSLAGLACAGLLHWLQRLGIVVANSGDVGVESS